MSVQYCFVRNSWNVISTIQNRDRWHEHSKPGQVKPWPRFLVSEEDIFVQSTATEKPFPSRLITMNGCTYRVSELPGPAISGDKAYRDVFSVQMKNEWADAIQIQYQGQHKVGEPDETSESGAFENFFDQLLDEMIFIIRFGIQVENTVSTAVYWHELLALLKRDYDEDPAKYALISELAEAIVPPLERIARRPRKVLKRIRDQERIQKVREFDKRCLFDLASRPGSTLPEKAGPRQRVLSIKREESADVLENQVFLHCCELLSKSSKRYLETHHKIRKSARKDRVDWLSRCCKRLSGAHSLRGVSRLQSPCRIPNYALLQNTYYSKIWNVYTRLLRNEQLRDMLWRWSRRLWSDYLALYLADTVLDWFQSLGLPVFVEVGEKVIQAHARPYFGKWLLSDVLPGPFVLGPDSESAGTLYAVDGFSIDFLGAGANCLSSLNADFLLVWLSDKKSRVLPVYAHLVVDNGGWSNSGQQFDATATELLSEMEIFNSKHQNWECIGAWLLLGPPPDSEWDNLEMRQHHQLNYWQTVPPTDPLAWYKLEGERFSPLANLTELGDHVPRN